MVLVCIQKSYESPLAYQAWELSVNVVATKEWNEWKHRSKWVLICHKPKMMTEFKPDYFNISPCNLDFVKNVETLKSNIDKMLIGVKH